MKAIDRPFPSIINGTSQFIVPVFQRDYSWTESHCEQILQDIIHIANEPSDRGHFLGSLVYIATGDSAPGFTRWLLIDGQQRLASSCPAVPGFGRASQEERVSGVCRTCGNRESGVAELGFDIRSEC